METYVAKGHFTTTTYFITADVKNLYTKIPRNGALQALMRFLEKYSNQGKIGTFRIDHIMKAARLILDTNCFAYENTYYRQISGGAMGSAFTQVLANIYMFEWEQELIQYQERHQGIYGRFVHYSWDNFFRKPILIHSFRYIDDIFIATNQPLDEIHQELEIAQTKDVNIEIETTINTSINYLDVTITNENGKLKTTIYHKPTTEPYYLPYTSDHPHRYHHNIPYSVILRAARICSHIHDFNQERLRIQTTLLLCNYPAQIISREFLRFFKANNAESLIQQSNEKLYQYLHKSLLHNRTRPSKQAHYSLQEHIQNPKVLKEQLYPKRSMYVKYKFQSSITTKFSNYFHEWWRKHYVYPGCPVNNVKIILLPKTNSNLRKLLIHKKPSRQILKRLHNNLI